MKNPYIASLINMMAKMDQSMIKNYRAGEHWDFKLIRFNTSVMKNIVDIYGWPTINLVGRIASNNAWLLVQHSDHDKEFQKKILHLLKKEHKKSSTNINPKNIAYLEDRVLVHQKKKQVYGTQFIGNPPKLLPVKDRTNLNIRRKSVGLGKIEELLKEIEKK